MNSDTRADNERKKGSLIYEGKGKKLFEVMGRANEVWVEFKDDLTAFNAQKKGSFKNKGAINCSIATKIFKHLSRNDIVSHWVASLSDTEMICEKLEIIPLEVVVRNRVAGSFAKKFGLEEGAEIPGALVEFYYKDDGLQDPFLSDDQALYLKAAKDQAELEVLKTQARKVNKALIPFFDKMGISLVDFKLEFGRNQKRQIILGDEISPDSCRLWDKASGEKLDKDRFRRDLGGVSEGYQEVLNRINKSGVDE